MPDLFTLIQQMNEEDYFVRIARNPLSQFGPTVRPYLGPTILPERLVPENAYREDAIRYRTLLANDGTRYSPAQKKAPGVITGEFLVELGDSDIATEFTGRDYDALLRLLATGENPTMQAMAAIINWVDVAVNRALIERLEKQRWDAIVSAQVVRQGDNGYTETVTYPNPAGHRVAVGGDWTDDTYDPWDDIMAMAELLWDKGYEVNRIITSRKVVGILSRNAKIAQRTARIQLTNAGALVGIAGRVSQADINAQLQADGLPNLETYDLRYRTPTSTGRFLPEDAMVFLATTGRDETVDWGDDSRFIPDVLGYTAIGRAVGQSEPGRVIRVEAFDNKPPRIEAEGWQTALPVITEPEAIAVLTSIGVKEA